MEKISTLHYFLNNTLNPEENEGLNKLNLLLNQDMEEYYEVFEYLDSLKRDVREEVVQRIMRYAKRFLNKT